MPPYFLNHLEKSRVLSHELVNSDLELTRLGPSGAAQRSCARASLCLTADIIRGARGRKPVTRRSQLTSAHVAARQLHCCRSETNLQVSDQMKPGTSVIDPQTNNHKPGSCFQNGYNRRHRILKHVCLVRRLLGASEEFVRLE